MDPHFDPTYTGLGCANDNNGVDVGECEFTGSVLNRTKTQQRTYGLQGQLTLNQDLWGKKNQFVMGSVLEYTKINFRQSALINVANIDLTDATTPTNESGNPGVWDANRGMIFTGAGIQPETQNTGLKGKQYQVSLFANDTLSMTDKWHVNAGARLNYTKVDNIDTLRGSHAVSEQSLTAKDSYVRLNPTLGLTYTLKIRKQFIPPIVSRVVRQLQSNWAALIHNSLASCQQLWLMIPL